jgi:hypothetical protein
MDEEAVNVTIAAVVAANAVVHGTLPAAPRPLDAEEAKDLYGEAKHVLFSSWPGQMTVEDIMLHIFRLRKCRAKNIFCRSARRRR